MDALPHAYARDHDTPAPPPICHRRAGACEEQDVLIDRRNQPLTNINVL